MKTFFKTILGAVALTTSLTAVAVELDVEQAHPAWGLQSQAISGDESREQVKRTMRRLAQNGGLSTCTMPTDDSDRLAIQGRNALTDRQRDIAAAMTVHGARIVTDTLKLKGIEVRDALLDADFTVFVTVVPKDGESRAEADLYGQRLKVALSDTAQSPDGISYLPSDKIVVEVQEVSRSWEVVRGCRVPVGATLVTVAG